MTTPTVPPDKDLKAMTQRELLNLAFQLPRNSADWKRVWELMVESTRLQFKALRG